MRMILHAKIPHEKFNADVEFHVAMTPEELGRAGLENLGEKWS
jgi:hypothetical protein